MSTYSSLTAQNVSASIIRPVAGTEVTISSLYTSSEPAPISYTYKWYKSTRLTAPVECEYGVIPADFVLYNANNDEIETSSITATMAGTYRCDVEAKNPDNMIVGQQVTFFSVLPTAIVLSEANTIGYAPVTVPTTPVDPGESGPPVDPDAEEPFWLDSVPSETPLLASLIYGGGKFVGLSREATGNITYSYDSINWSIAQTPEPTSMWTSMAYGDGKFVAVSKTGAHRVMCSFA